MIPPMQPYGYYPPMAPYGENPKKQTAAEMVADILKARTQDGNPIAPPGYTPDAGKQSYINDLVQKLKQKLPRKINWKIKNSYMTKEEKEMRKMIKKMRKHQKALATKAKGMTTIQCKSNRLIKVVGVSVSDKKKEGSCQYLKDLKKYAKKRCDGLPICRVPNRNLRLEERCPDLKCEVYLDIRCQSATKGLKKELSKKMELPWIKKLSKRDTDTINCEPKGLMKMIGKAIDAKASLKYCPYLKKLVTYLEEICEDGSSSCRIPKRVLRKVVKCEGITSAFNIDSHCVASGDSKLNPQDMVSLEGVSKDALFNGKYAIVCFPADKQPRSGSTMAQNVRKEADSCPLLDGNRLDSMVEAIRNSNIDNAKRSWKSQKKQKEMKKKRKSGRKFNEKVRRKTGDNYATRRRHRDEKHRLNERKSNHVISSRDRARLRKGAGRYREPKIKMREDFFSRARRNLGGMEKIPGNSRCYRVESNKWKDLQLLSRVSRRTADGIIEIEPLKTRRNDRNLKGRRNYANTKRQRTAFEDRKERSWHQGAMKPTPKRREFDGRGRKKKSKWTEFSRRINKRVIPGRWNNFKGNQ